MLKKQISLELPDIVIDTNADEPSFDNLSMKSQSSSDLESLDSIILSKMIPSKRQAAEEQYELKKQEKIKKRKQKIIDQQQKKIQILNLDFTPHKIMLILSKQMLGDIHEMWKVFEEGITLLQFCQLMIDKIKTLNDDQKYELIYGCYKLFLEVDINGDGKMEWDEFMQYIIDKVSRTGLEDGDQGESVKQQIEKMKSRKFNKFSQQRKITDKSSHKNILQKAIYCESTQLIFTFEKFQSELKLYNINLELQIREKVPMKVKGFITCVAFDEKNQLYGISSTDKNLHFYTHIQNRIEYLKNIETPCIQTRIFYLPKQDLWLTSGRDFKLRHWNISKQGTLLQTLDIHTDKITDCIEIVNMNPMCIATCSLDQKIVFYDVINQEHLRTIKKHEKGIRLLRYQNFHGPFMASIGLDQFVNIWQPNSLVSDIHYGKLNGHKSQILDGQFLCKAPFFVTLDEQGIIYFWDIQSLFLVQCIVNVNKLYAEALLCYSQHKIFLYGKRFIQFDTQNPQIEDEQIGKPDKLKSQDDNSYPIQAVINNFFLNIQVVTKNEIRIFDLQKGQLQGLNTHIFDQETQSCDITKFKIDKRHRKAYIANNKGNVIVIDIRSGITIKHVISPYQQTIKSLENQVKIYDKTLEKYDSDGEEIQKIDHFKNIKSDNSLKNLDQKQQKNKILKERHKSQQLKKQNSKNEIKVKEVEQAPKQIVDKHDNKHNEINEMHLIWEDQDNMIMMVCSNQKEYMVFDERDVNQSTLLRRIYGTHLDEITISAYDHYLQIVATGTINGEIALYDFETSKMLGFLIGHQGDITSIEFISPYPVMVTASMDCTICIWGVRPCPEKLQNVCIKTIQNISWRIDQEVKCAAIRLLVWQQEMKGIRKYRPLLDKQLKAEENRNFEQNFVFAFRELESIFKEEFPEEKLYQYADYTKEQKLKMVLDGKLFYNILNDDIQKTFITLIESNNYQYQQQLNVMKERTYLVLGDELGYLKILDLTDILKQSKIQKVGSVILNKKTFNPFRMETIDQSLISNQLRKEIHSQNKKLPPAVDPSLVGILIRSARAHSDVITSLQKIQYHDCNGIVSASKDNRVRVWSIELDLWGNLDQKNFKEDKKWNIPTNQYQIEQRQEIQIIENLMDDMRLNLQYPRRKLDVVVQKEQLKEEMKNKQKINFLQLQEERIDREKNMFDKQIKERKQIELRREWDKFYLQRLQKIISGQDLEMHVLKMDVPIKLEGQLRKLQIELNEKQRMFSTDILDELYRSKDDTQNKKNKKLKPRLQQSKINLLQNSQLALLTAQKQKFPKKMDSKQNTLQVYETINSTESANDSEKKYKINKRKSSNQLSQSSQKSRDYTVSPDKKGHDSRSTPNGKNQKQFDITTEQSDFRFIRKHQMRHLNIKKVNLQDIVNQRQQSLSPIHLERFSDSNQDKKNILELGNIPQLRKKLESINIKDRFKVKQEISTSRTRNQSLTDYLKSKKHIDKVMMRIGSILDDPLFQKQLTTLDSKRDLQQRPFSIADSEIQKIQDQNGSLSKILIHDASKASLNSNLNLQNLKLAKNSSVIIEKEGTQSLQYLPQLSTAKAHLRLQSKTNLDYGQHILDKLDQDEDSIDPSNQFKSYKLLNNNNLKSPSSSHTVVINDFKINMPKNSQQFQTFERVILKNPFNNKLEVVQNQKDLNKGFASPQLSSQSQIHKGYFSVQQKDYIKPSQTPREDFHQLKNKLNLYLSSNSKSNIDNSEQQITKQKNSIIRDMLLSTEPSDILIKNEKLSALSSLVKLNKSTISQQSIINDIDKKKKNNFEYLKLKYTGAESSIALEQKKMQEKLDQQKIVINDMKKNQKFKTLRV